MTTTRNHRALTLVACAGALLTVPAVANAQAERNEREIRISERENRGEAPLRGPRIDREAAPARAAARPAQRLDQAQADDDEEAEVPFAVFQRSLRTMGSAEGDQHLAMSDRQRDAVQVVFETFRDTRAAYMQEHREEIAQLRREAGMDRGAARGRPGAERGDWGQRGERGRRPQREGDRPGARGEGRGGPATGERPARQAPEEVPENVRQARERIRTIMAGAPSDADVRRTVWVLLTPDQREHLEARFEEYHERQAELRRQMREGRTGELPDNIRERLANMSPEEREQAMRRIRATRGQNGDRPQNRPQRGERPQRNRPQRDR